MMPLKLPGNKWWWIGGAGALLLLLRKDESASPSTTIYRGRPGVWIDARVEPEHTSYTAAQVKQYITAALREGLGYAPTAQQVRTLVAQSAFETDNWQKMWNNNFVNQTVGSTTVPYFQLHEVSVHHYKSFDTPELGARSFVQLIKGNYKAAWALMDDPAAYAEALCKQMNTDGTCKSGFYEAHVAAYRTGVLSKQKLA